jgi:uncharacterized damage-inducible protein DinB
MAIERTDPPLSGDERATLVGFLDWHRDTLAFKCEGLTDEQLRLQSSPPSTLSLLGLVRHMAEVERAWFRRGMRQEDIGLVWPDDWDYDVMYDATDASVEEAFASWQTEIEHARRIERSIHDLDTMGHRKDSRTGLRMSLRWVLVHMIEEYARHNGHADFLREAIDGTVGE